LDRKRVRLYLLRHGIAEETAPQGDDGARRLTDAGRARMRAQAAGMRALGLSFDVILTSPLVRAAQTAAIVAAAFSTGPAPREFPALAGGVPAAEILEALRPLVRSGHVLAVGHEPDLGRLAALILTGSTEGLALRMNKGTMAAIDLRSARPKAGAELRWVLTPRQLRCLGK
jgi:phosphohistidine phosphatase